MPESKNFMKNQTAPSTYYVKTFGCQMNYADSEKVNMVLLQSGLRKVLDPAKADVVILNTCSVRQKGEDRVFGYAHEIKKLAKTLGKDVFIGITGCMVRKT
ncbi:MAG: tRNA-2-methylthio-N6-dimethylallyladenosine synthase [Patescibacteria group bacterium]|nr:tRNA-2-methylthio-N6-dimethylallyladenosine synthase [Patescibacteria group bacterium]